MEGSARFALIKKEGEIIMIVAGEVAVGRIFSPPLTPRLGSFYLNKPFRP
jgi:hypothetical protein